MHRMSNLEYAFMARELSPLKGKHFARIRKIDEGKYRMKIGNAEIICEAGIRLHITRYMEEAQPHDKFVQKVEKELDNAKLIAVEQVNMDRIIAFRFDRGELIFEMFGKGNIILVEEGKAVAAMKSESWSDREIRPGAPYAPPGKKPSDELKPSDKYIIVSMMALPLGKEYALEALARLGIDEKTPGKELSGNLIAKIEAEAASIMSSAKPLVFLEEGAPIDFSLTPLSKHKGLEAKEHATLSEAADEYYAGLKEPLPELEKLQKRLDKQKERLALLKDEENRCKEIGDHIYANYNGIEELLEKAKSGKYEGKIDKKEKTIEADL